MSERISPCQISKIEQIGKEALDIVDETYGEGYQPGGKVDTNFPTIMAIMAARWAKPHYAYALTWD